MVLAKNLADVYDFKTLLFFSACRSLLYVHFSGKSHTALTNQAAKHVSSVLPTHLTAVRPSLLKHPLPLPPNCLPQEDQLCCLNEYLHLSIFYPIMGLNESGKWDPSQGQVKHLNRKYHQITPTRINQTAKCFDPSDL